MTTNIPNLAIYGMIAIGVIVGIAFGIILANVAIVGADALHTRTLQCQETTISNTDMLDTSSFYVTVDNNSLLVLDSAKPNVMREWGRIELNDTVYMKLGERTVEFC